MEESTSREKILKKIRKALMNKPTRELGDVNKDAEVFTPSNDPLEIQFAQSFTGSGGKFIFCESTEELIENIRFMATDAGLQNLFCKEPQIQQWLTQSNVSYTHSEPDFLNINIGISFCECLAARTGSIIISSKQVSGRRLPFYANTHIVIAYTSQIVSNIKDGITFIKNKYNNQLPSMITAITGPSQTADIEKTLVQGAHGPKDVFVFLLDDL
jgi:L-lactate dehydrogenase complex protein LldG